MSFDALAVGVIGLSTFFGFFIGFIMMSINLITFAASLVLSGFLMKYLSSVMSYNFTFLPKLNMLSTSVSYAISLVICDLLARRVKHYIRGAISGGFVDRFSGIFVGAVSGIILMVLVIWGGLCMHNSLYTADIHLILSDKMERPTWMQESAFYKAVEDMSKSEIVKRYIPPKDTSNGK
jgi:membrane protein required for colicin V production